MPDDPPFPNFVELAKARDEFHNLCVSWINEHGIPGEGKPLLAGLFLSRATELFAGLTQLAFRGHNAGASIILRSMFECVVYSRACMWNDKYMNEYLAQNEKERQKQYNRILQLKSPILKDLASQIDPESIKEGQEMLDSLEASGTCSLEAFSRVAEMHDWYLLLHFLHSGEVHVTVDSLQKDLVVGAEGEIQEFNLGVSFSDSKRNISTAGLFLTRVLREAQVAYWGKEDELPEEWEGRWTKLAGLVPET